MAEMISSDIFAEGPILLSESLEMTRAIIDCKFTACVSVTNSEDEFANGYCRHSISLFSHDAARQCPRFIII